MRYIGTLLGYILLGINAVVSVLLLFVAYSPYLDPQVHPTASCAGLFFPIFLVPNLLFFVFWLIVYRRYALFPLIVLLCCWSSIQTYFPMNWSGNDAPENSIKVLSYNTEAFSNLKPHTKETPNPVLKYLQESQADIICLQEYIFGGKLKRKDIDYALREYPYKHYLPLNNSLNGLGCYSRYPILSAHPIKYTSSGNGSILYNLKVGEDTLTIINNHLESFKIADTDVETLHDIADTPNRQKLSTEGRKLLKKLAVATKIRAAQADTIRLWVKKAKGKHLIVCGDFNDSPISYTHHALCQELEDAFAGSGNGLGISYHQHHLYFRIDHILTSKNMEVHDCQVDNTIKASDHYPIWCHVSLK